MSRLGILFLLLNIHCFTFAQTNDFSAAVWQVIDGFNQQDNRKINSLIDERKGVIVLTRLGVIERLELSQKIDFKKPIPEYLPYSGVSPPIPKEIKAGNLPQYNCDNDSWSKVGIYFVESNQDALFMRIVDFLIQFNEAKIEQVQYQYYRFINENSRRVVAVDSEGNALVFYLTKIKDNWYLTIIDRVSDDCSA